MLRSLEFGSTANGSSGQADKSADALIKLNHVLMYLHEDDGFKR
jgi:hypothetical protein